MWKYFEENICVDGPVAEFTNSKNICVLQVFECRNYYLATPKYLFLDPIQIPCICTIDEEAEKKLSFDEVLPHRLKVACNLIEEKYKEQVNSILSVVG